MKNEQFNLSKRMYIIDNNGQHLIMEDDVKEFIRLLKENIDEYCKLHQYKSISQQGIFNGIDKLAGNKLI